MGTLRPIRSARDDVAYRRSSPRPDSKKDMCGIAGTFNGSKLEVAQMLKRIAHRGPDGSGIHQAGESVLPRQIVKRIKDTFQGGSGISDAVARQVATPIKFYNAELKKHFGYLPKD